MNHKTMKRCLGVIGMLIVLSLHPYNSFGGDIYTLMEGYLDNSRVNGSFSIPPESELEEVEKLFYKFFRGDRTESLTKDWNALNYAMEKLEVSVNEAEQQKEGEKKTKSVVREFTLLIEKETHRTGRGFYILSDTPLTSHVLMIPHGLHDFHTSEIGIKLMLEGHFAAASFNTVHRYGNKKPDVVLSEETWDMAARLDTYFVAFSRAFATAFPEGILLQLHGFSSDKRNSITGKNSDFIISSGTETVSFQMEKLRDCLGLKIPETISLYPDDVQELGGTKNAIGSVLRDKGHHGFIHIEMNLSTRKKIKDDSGIRQLILSCIGAL